MRVIRGGLKAYAKGTYRGIAWGSFVMLVAALVYFVMPVDLIPDFLVGLGLVDDAAVLAWTVRTLSSEIDAFLAWERELIVFARTALSSSRSSMAVMYHPKKDENGKLRVLNFPSQPSELAAWGNPSLVATVIPEGAMPAELHGIAFSPWLEAPRSDQQWANVEGDQAGLVDEPAFVPTPGKRVAAGAVIIEPDGRVWVVHPSNGFGGYQATFPKGTADKNDTLQRTAMREAFEESGLQIQITGFLADSERSQSKTRYYLARRVGGTPAEMGWETQASSLVPIASLGSVLTHPNDVPLVKALQQMVLAGLA